MNERLFELETEALHLSRSAEAFGKELLLNASSHHVLVGKAVRMLAREYDTTFPCVVDKVPITPSDCVALSSGLRSLSGEFIVLQPSNVEVLSAGTCETAFYNRQTTADLQVCLDDWAGLVAGLNAACPGDFAQCQGESLTGVIGQQWIIQITLSARRTNFAFMINEWIQASELWKNKQNQDRESPVF
ncbi:hypothetical protein SISNIDRAFT_464865 [Sistotremastrum niveocremeum HHB9708]|uniref:Uncharacterized protein n=1 Tax=Sistotremastrum niveocremeum HHB9708 TaxID=1314777 RepID=A0A164WNP3_9AGAM|nr:hypothetical protein SISNIDRAFT_464865 [Sistotremastrum niveocremeum HHB9708]